MILKSSESDDESSLKSSFESLENQERLDGHDNQYLRNNTEKDLEPFKRVINGEMKSPDLLVDPNDGKWNPMVVIIASCCIGRIFN